MVSAAVLTLYGTDESSRRATISVIPGDVLLDIFDFYRKNHNYSFRPVWEWHVLVHICRRWRQVIFGSPHRLNLQILCTNRTPVQRNLDIWPAFPIVLCYEFLGGNGPKGLGDVNAALEHPDRVCNVKLKATGSQLVTVVTVMQEPFPVLTHLEITSWDGTAVVLPAEFLGGSAPCLQEIYLYGVRFPALPSLLLSTNDLVALTLRGVSQAGYISSEAMIVGLAALTRLETLTIGIQSVTPRLDHIRPPPKTRTVLPALTSFTFQGAYEHLEDLVAQIESPQLDQIRVTYLNRLVDVSVAQLSEFVDRSMGPKFRRARVGYVGDCMSFSISRYANHPYSDWHSARTIVSCEGISWEVPHVTLILGQFSATLATIIHLELVQLGEARELENISDVEWLHLLNQFPATQTLLVSWELAGFVALALEHITGEMVAELLPSLDLICLEDQRESSVNNFEFVAARRLSDRPVTVVNMRKEFEKRLESYISK